MNVKKKYFGTDGIRGKAGEGKLSRETIAKLGLSIGKYLADSKSAPTVLIGRDTRESGNWIEELLVKGLEAFGAKVHLLGVLPTAAVSYLCLEKQADLGLMITASHNPFGDNGIKLFGPDGRKFSDDAQYAIEALLEADIQSPSHISGGAVLSHDMKSAYLSKIAGTVGNTDVSDLSVVLDCANGAAYQTAPDILKSLGVKKITLIGASPNGQNINLDCGSTHPENLCEAVRKHGADVGIAMDGDADRLIMCDENGDIIDGDQIMGALAMSWRDQGTLSHPVLVSTVMSNLGLERLMQKEGISLIRTAVGDRHVAAKMAEHDYNLGGEQSGHMLMPDYLPTGDGMLAAVQTLCVLARSKQPASSCLQVFKTVPQLLVNVRFDGQSPLEKDAVKAAIEQAHNDFAGKGRILIRASGTEPLIRVMAEGDDPDEVYKVVHDLADFIRQD